MRTILLTLLLGAVVLGFVGVLPHQADAGVFFNRDVNRGFYTYYPSSYGLTSYYYPSYQQSYYSKPYSSYYWTPGGTDLYYTPGYTDYPDNHYFTPGYSSQYYNPSVYVYP